MSARHPVFLAVALVTVVLGLTACGQPPASSSGGRVPTPPQGSPTTPPVTTPPGTTPPGSGTPPEGTKPPDPNEPPATPPPPTTQNQPVVTDMLPRDGYQDVRRDTSVTANIALGAVGKGVDPKTLKGNVKLYPTNTPAKPVAGTPGTDGAGGNITFQPNTDALEGGLLAPNTSYTFEVTSGVKDTRGVSFKPFKGSFTTGPNPVPVAPSVRFGARQAYPAPDYSNADAPVASLTMSPDGELLYGVTLDGRVMRWTADATTGALSAPETFAPEVLRGRALVGLAFDPENPQVLWISNNAPLYGQGDPPDFSGKISRVTINPLDFAASEVQDYVVGLPRSIKDHLTNSLAFHAGMLYVTQGANSSAGAKDPTWNRDEHLLSAAVLQIDPRRDVSAGPIDVQTEPYALNPDSPGTYNPAAPGAPVTVFADGVRNAYDLVWHSNGTLYLPTNGAASGGFTPASPDGAVPALKNLPTQKDFLFAVPPQGGGYYGHPIALRHHYVLNGGNPTENPDVAEVVSDGVRAGYPVGVQPDKDYRPPVWDFGFNRSPDGAIEYQGATFGGALQHKLLVVEYAGGDDILVLTLDAQGKVSNSEKIGVDVPDAAAGAIVDPIDLTEDLRNGNLYVAELVTQPASGQAPRSRIRLLTPQ